MTTYTATVYAHWLDNYITFTVECFTIAMAWQLAIDYNIANHDEGVLLYVEDDKGNSYPI